MVKPDDAKVWGIGSRTYLSLAIAANCLALAGGAYTFGAMSLLSAFNGFVLGGLVAVLLAEIWTG